MTMRMNGMMTNERFRGRGAPGDGRTAPRLPYPPGASSVSESGNLLGASARASGNEIPAYAGMTMMGAGRTPGALARRAARGVT